MLVWMDYSNETTSSPIVNVQSAGSCPHTLVFHLPALYYRRLLPPMNQKEEQERANRFTNSFLYLNKKSVTLLSQRGN